MAEPTDPVLIHLEYIKARVDTVVARLDAQNGRLAKNEMAIALIEDRATEARDVARQSGARWGASVGAGAAATIAAIWQFLSKP